MKNLLPIKWLLVIIAGLIAIVLWSHQGFKNTSSSAGLNASSSLNAHNPGSFNFFQFLGSLFGIKTQESILTPESKTAETLKNNDSNLSLPSGAAGPLGQGNPDSLSGASTPQAQGTDPAQQAAIEAKDKLTAEERNPASNSEMNYPNNAENNTPFGEADNPSYNAEYNAEGNSEINAMTNSQDNGVITIIGNPDNPTGDDAGSSAGNNSGNNSANSPGNNPGNNPGTIPASGTGNNPGNEPGNGSADSSNGNSGNSSGDNNGNPSGGFSGSTSTFLDPANLPTINPIPSNSQISQSIAQQNQQGSSLANIVASRQALVVPVVQQAQATKYQTVDAQNIPAVSTNQAPSDIIQKVQEHQLSLH